MGYHIPESFFMDLDDTLPVRNTFGCEGKGWTPSGAIKWYDNIIDDMLANPGTSMTDTARRLGRSPSTVHTITASDMFKARYAQRRVAFEEELNRRIAHKLTRAAELTLDATIEHLEKKRDAVPLPVLNELAKTTLDRLGYSPKGEAPQVNVINNNNVVSAEALAAAREKLKIVEQVSPREASDRKLGNQDRVLSDPVAGPEKAEGEED